MYGNVIIPQAVFDEVTVKDDSACHTIKALDWINVRRIASQDDRRMYKAKLHAGEVQVMILAQELGVDVLTVIDDNAARKTARYAAPQEGRSNCSGVKSRAFLDCIVFNNYYTKFDTYI